MSSQTPEIDTRPHEAPATAQEPHPGPAAMMTTWLGVGVLATVVNIVVLAIAVAAGVDMQADLAAMSLQVNWLTVIVATLAWIAFAAIGWGLLAHRVPALAHIWVPLHWGMAVVAGGALVAVAGSVATAITLVVMDVVANAAAAHLVPRRLPR